MHKTVKRRIQISADANAWNYSSFGNVLSRDGYEVYFSNENNGFELTVLNPKTRTRETVFKMEGEDVCTSSPSYIALIQEVLREPERFALSGRGGMDNDPRRTT